MTKLSVAAQKGDPWEDTLSVALDDRLHLWYKIVLEEDTKVVRVVFPVYDEHEDNSIEKADAIMSSDEWGAINITSIDKDDLKRRDNLPGAFDISNLDDKTEVIFQLDGKELSEDDKFMSGVVVCKIQEKKGRKFKDVSQISLVKQVEKPKIVSFTIDRAVLIDNESPTLSWNVQNADKIEIIDQKGSKIHEDNTIEGSWEAPKQALDASFTLRSWNGKTPGEEKTINIKTFSSSEVATWSNPFDGQKLMGLYPHPLNDNTSTDRMLALVLDDGDDDKSKHNVRFYESEYGLDWSPSVAYSKIPAFIDNQRNSENIPLEYAESPGVVVGEKLFLAGGSRFNPNQRSNDTYFYDFGEEDKGWQKLEINGTNPISPRMGHACINYKGSLWLLGGFDNKGASQQCFILDEAQKKWEPAKDLNNKCCMGSALVIQKSNSTEIQLFGGFGKVPGNPDRTIIDASKYADGKWTSIDWDRSIDEKLAACAAFTTRGEQFVLYTTYQKGSYQHKVKSISGSILADVVPANLKIDNSFHHIQALTFKDVVWFCITHPGRMPQGDDLKYFVYR